MKSRLNGINLLALRLHGGRAQTDAFTFQSLREHIDEVCELLTADDPHWRAETLDIIIHCYLMLERHGVSMEEIKKLQKERFGRFKEKIKEEISYGKKDSGD